MLSYLDDAIINTINNLVYNNQSEILAHIAKNDSALQKVLKDFQTGLCDSIGFLHELLVLSQSMGDKHDALIDLLEKNNVVDVIVDAALQISQEEHIGSD